MRREDGLRTKPPQPRPRGRPRYDAEDGASAENFRRIARTIRVARDDAVPLWVQLKNQIGEAIRSGALPENARLPSEQALCGIFEISRPVIRGAIAALASEGRVIKVPRKGMFVAARVQAVDLVTSTLGVFGDLSAKGHEPTVRTFAFGLAPADQDERRVFGLPDGFDVLRIVRVYASDGRPLTHTRISLPAHRLPGMERLDIENKPLFETIRQHYGLTVARADRWLKAAMPPPEVAERMGVPPHEPMIFIESIAYDHDGNPLEFYRAFYDSAVASIHVATDRQAERHGPRPRR
ncbi:MAG: GntR family transcriptional regulator [Geminicoccaceae bacterium]|nr:GntR family transcriptional regulator [Geminicoccaceae bacterium]